MQLELNLLLDRWIGLDCMHVDKFYVYYTLILILININ